MFSDEDAEAENSQQQMQSTHDKSSQPRRKVYQHGRKTRLMEAYPHLLPPGKPSPLPPTPVPSSQAQSAASRMALSSPHLAVGAPPQGPQGQFPPPPPPSSSGGSPQFRQPLPPLLPPRPPPASRQFPPQPVSQGGPPPPPPSQFRPHVPVQPRGPPPPYPMNSQHIYKSRRKKIRNAQQQQQQQQHQQQQQQQQQQAQLSIPQLMTKMQAALQAASHSWITGQHSMFTSHLIKLLIWVSNALDLQHLQQPVPPLVSTVMPSLHTYDLTNSPQAAAAANAANDADTDGNA